ncbi:nitroreductase family protein [Chloroflexota bacterium]
MIGAINKRISVRSYADQPIEPDKKQELINLLQSTSESPFGNKVRFTLIDFSEMERNEIRSLGTYGFISGAKLFIVGAINDDFRAMEDLGYCFEKVILTATNMGLGTCWMGGTFRRANFAKKTHVLDDEVVPAISPIGYARDKQTIREKVLRRFVSSDHRKPWEDLFFDGDMNKPLLKDVAGEYDTPLECVRLGPSASNNQPWRMVYNKQQGIFHLYLKRTWGYDKFNGRVDLQRIDMGIAMCHFELGARETGLSGTWEVANTNLDISNAEYIVTWK